MTTKPMHRATAIYRKAAILTAAVLGLMLSHAVSAQEAATEATSAVADLGEITGNAEAGEKAFRKCMACHDVGADAKNKVGPVLTGIVGHVAAANPDFSYSNAMTEAGENGLIWTVAELDAFLAKPKDYMAGTKMTFAGLRKEDERADVIAYLHSIEGAGDEGS